MKPSTNKKLSVSTVLLTALLIFFIAVFAVSAYMLISYLINSRTEQGRYEDNEQLNEMSSIIAGITNSPVTFTAFTYTTTSPIDTTTPSDTSDTVVPDDSDSDTEVPTDGTTDDEPIDSTEPTDTDTATEPPETTTTEPVTTPPEPVYSDEFLAMRNKILELQKINPDIAGYISIPLLEIGYPLLSRPDDYGNAYYLTRAFDLSESLSGSIFYDFRCDPDPLKNRNTVLYGHNMRDGSMFANLKGCYNQEKLFHDTEIFIATLDGLYVFKLFSVYSTTSELNYCRTDFASEASFYDFYHEMRSYSRYQPNSSFVPENAPLILTLSTCTNQGSSGRYALHAVLVNDLTEKK